MMAVAEEKVRLWFWKKFFPVVFFFQPEAWLSALLKDFFSSVISGDIYSLLSSLPVTLSSQPSALNPNLGL